MQDKASASTSSDHRGSVDLETKTPDSPESFSNEPSAESPSSEIDPLTQEVEPAASISKFDLNEGLPYGEKPSVEALPPTSSSSSTTATSQHSHRRRRRHSSSRSHSRSSSRGIGSDIGDAQRIPYSSPAQVYRNLLIMEESFRQQYAAMTVSRRNHVVFFTALILVTAYYTYAVFVMPSIYKLVIFIDRLMFMGAVITLGLFYLTGLYTKTFVYGPKFFYSLNKGLRPYNMKLVKIPQTWSESIIGLLWNPSYQAAPGRLVKLVLSTRSFSTETIHAWDLYRQDYWDREAERSYRIKQRAKLKKINDKDKDKDKTDTAKTAATKGLVHGHHSTRLQHLTSSLPSTPSLIPSA